MVYQPADSHPSKYEEAWQSNYVDWDVDDWPCCHIRSQQNIFLFVFHLSMSVRQGMHLGFEERILGYWTDPSFPLCEEEVDVSVSSWEDVGQVWMDKGSC